MTTQMNLEEFIAQGKINDEMVVQLWEDIKHLDNLTRWYICVTLLSLCISKDTKPHNEAVRVSTTMLLASEYLMPKRLREL